MAWVNIADYSLKWNANSNIGTIYLWFAGAQINPNLPHQTLTNLRSDQYVAIAQTLRGDTDHKVFFRPSARYIFERYGTDLTTRMDQFLVWHKKLKPRTKRD